MCKPSVTPPQGIERQDDLLKAPIKAGQYKSDRFYIYRLLTGDEKMTLTEQKFMILGCINRQKEQVARWTKAAVETPETGLDYALWARESRAALNFWNTQLFPRIWGAPSKQDRRIRFIVYCTAANMDGIDDETLNTIKQCSMNKIRRIYEEIRNNKRLENSRLFKIKAFILNRIPANRSTLK